MTSVVDPLPWSLRWGRFLLGMVVGAATMTSGAVIWGDARYVRRSEFTSHAEAQRELERHAGEDARRFLTREEFIAGNPVQVEQNRVQDLRIRVLEQNQAWMAQAIYAIARKNGVQLRPPPLTP